MRGTRRAGLFALLMLGTVLAAPPAQAGNGVLTPAQEAAVYNTLIANGMDAATATSISKDYDQAVQIPVSTSEEVVSGKTKGGPLANSIGTCSGSGGWVQRIQYENNAYGAHLAYIKLRTNFNYNGSRVTCASSSRNYYVYALGSATMVWQGWDDFTEYFYTSGGHLNGGALANTQGTFGVCVIKYGCGYYVHPWAETRAYWNGTWVTYGAS